MERKNNVFNATHIEDTHYLKNNINTCKYKFMLFKYGFSETGRWLPADIKNIIIDKYILLEIQLQKFLRLVAEGEQDQAEDMLKEHPDLVLLAGDVTDLSKRSFHNITGLQYAVWALDYHMWTMLLKYLNPADITKQLKDMETGSWVEIHGKSASWQNLIDALGTYISLCNRYKWDEAANQWNIGVGDAQALLPVHVVNEYCHPNRSFDPCPNFKDAAPLPRSRLTDKGEWFTATYNGDGLGTGKFALARAWGRGAARAVRWRAPVVRGRCIRARATADQIAVATLLQNRVEQRQAIFTEYIGNAMCNFKYR